MDKEITQYNQRQESPYRELCEQLEQLLSSGLPEATAKVWHGHPVWFLNDNPTVGYSARKAGVQLMFWSGRSFDEPELTGTSRFKDASIFYNSLDELDREKINSWLNKSKTIQWDYKNIVKRKGVLEPLSGVGE